MAAKTYLDDQGNPFDPTGGETWTPQPEPIVGGNPTDGPMAPPKSGVGSPETPQVGPGDQTGIGQINGPTEGTGGQPSSPLAGQPGDGPGTPQRIDTSGEGGGGTIPSDVLLHQPLPDAQASQGYANITGLDTNKLNDPNKNDVKYGPEARAFALAVGRTNAGNGDPSLSALDPASLPIIVQRLKDQGYNASFDGDRLDFGNGVVIDVMLDSGHGGPAAGKGWGWIPKTGAEAQANGDQAGGPSGDQGLVQGATRGASAASAGAGRPAPPPGYDYDNGGNLVDAFGHPAPAGVGGGGGQTPVQPQGLSSDFSNQVRKMIMDRLGVLGQPVNEQDPQIAQAVTAARDEATRSQDTERTALAERLYAQGGGALNSNALTQGIQQSSERNAAGVGSLRANLIMKQYTQNRAEMQGLLTQALQSGDRETALRVQQQMAALDAEIRREGYGINLAEFGAQLNQNAALAGLHG